MVCGQDEVGKGVPCDEDCATLSARGEVWGVCRDPQGFLFQGHSVTDMCPLKSSCVQLP